MLSGFRRSISRTTFGKRAWPRITRHYATAAPKRAIDWRFHGIKLSLFASAVIVESYLLYGSEEKLSNDAISYIPVYEVQKHNKADDCWISINGKVYDVTKFLSVHPGGTARILQVAGGDATKSFLQMHSQETLNKMMPYLDYLGVLQGQFEQTMTAEEQVIFENAAKKPPLSQIFNISDFEYVAKRVLPKSTFFYYATGSTDEFSIRENHYAYSRVFFKPKALQEVSPEVDTSSSFMGTEVDFPIYITAFAGSKFAHPMGELNLQRAAYKANIMQMVPKLLSYSLDEFFSQVPEDQEQWFQLHFEKQHEMDNVEHTLKIIEKYKNIKAIFVNVDVPDLGNREKDSKVRAENLAVSAQLSTAADNSAHYPSAFSWSDLERIRNATSLPICLKGVQRGEDVVLAAEKGISAVVLSNHGGRQLDFSRPPLEVLVEAKQLLKEKGLENKIDIFLDGGIRRGSDIVKALCLGATGVGMGRPFLYAMSGYGEEGCSKLISLLKAEVVNNMKLLGVDNIKDLTEDLVDTTNLKFRNPMINDRLYDNAYEQLPFPKFESRPTWIELKEPLPDLLRDRVGLLDDLQLLLLLDSQQLWHDVDFQSFVKLESSVVDGRTNQQNGNVKHGDVSGEEIAGRPVAWEEHVVTIGDGQDQVEDHGEVSAILHTWDSVSDSVVEVSGVEDVSVSQVDHTGESPTEETRNGHNVGEPGEHSGGRVGAVEVGKEGEQTGDTDTVDWHTESVDLSEDLGSVTVKSHGVKRSGGGVESTGTTRVSRGQETGVDHVRQAPDTNLLDSNDERRGGGLLVGSDGRQQSWVVVSNHDTNDKDTTHVEEHQTVDDSSETLGHRLTRVLGLTGTRSKHLGSQNKGETTLDNGSPGGQESAGVAGHKVLNEGARVVPVVETQDSVSVWSSTEENDNTQDDQTSDTQDLDDGDPELTLSEVPDWEKVDGDGGDDKDRNEDGRVGICPVGNDIGTSSDFRGWGDGVGVENVPANGETQGTVGVLSGQGVDRGSARKWEEDDHLTESVHNEPHANGHDQVGGQERSWATSGESRSGTNE